ncbi:MAG TPA: PHP-associated domain-containing protein [Clostridia bacterium]|nr:PHP-associated domain-containing protein [Clostridia bacterium]
MMKFELHAHTKENDICVNMTADEIVTAYKGAGYDGIVITNHFFDLSLEWYKDELAGCDHGGLIDYYLKSYKKAKATGDAIGMTVLLGLELRFDGTINDYLVYGVEEDFLYRSPLLNTLNLDSFLKILPAGAIVYQAHPFRNDMTITDPTKLYGIEVYNGGTSHSRNEFAQRWADQFKLKKISGSDFHGAQHLARGGVMFENDVHNTKQLVAELKGERYSLIKTV